MKKASEVFNAMKNAGEVVPRLHPTAFEYCLMDEVKALATRLNEVTKQLCESGYVVKMMTDYDLQSEDRGASELYNLKVKILREV